MRSFNKRISAYLISLWFIRLSQMSGFPGFYSLQQGQHSQLHSRPPSYPSISTTFDEARRDRSTVTNSDPPSSAHTEAGRDIQPGRQGPATTILPHATSVGMSLRMHSRREAHRDDQCAEGSHEPGAIRDHREVVRLFASFSQMYQCYKLFNPLSDCVVLSRRMLRLSKRVRGPGWKVLHFCFDGYPRYVPLS